MLSNGAPDALETALGEASEEGVMRNKILGWIGIVWGTLVLLRGLTRVFSGDVSGNAYGAGQLAAFAFGGLLVFA